MTVLRGSGASLALLLIAACLMHRVTSSQQEDSSNYYTGAVVEYAPTHIDNDATATLRENSQAYVEYIKQASQQNADIIVFPEYGLTSVYVPNRPWLAPWTTVIPSPLENYTPCMENRYNVSEALRRISCAARQHRIYVMVNILEKADCQPNDSSCRGGIHIYNSNVVFDRNGKIVARYRKTHLITEFALDAAEKAELVTFDTDFGVTFGTFICFDIFYHTPVLNLTRTLGITNFVYPTAWYSDTPFLTAIQAHFGWAYAENVNLLSSGYHELSHGSVGSGIFLGRRGIGAATIATSPDRRLLISRIPKTTELASGAPEQLPYDPTQRLAKPGDRSVVETQEAGDVEWIKLLRDNITSYASVLLNVSMKEKLCYGDFCCDFDLRTEGPVDPRVRYRAMIYDGFRWHGHHIQLGIRVCGLVQCSDDSIQSCGSVESSNTRFTTANITASFNDSSNVFVMPSVIDHALFPIEHIAFTEHVDAERTVASISLTRPTENIVTFSLYSRNYVKDKYYEL